MATANIFQDTFLQRTTMTHVYYSMTYIIVIFSIIQHNRLLYSGQLKGLLEIKLHVFELKNGKQNNKPNKMNFVVGTKFI